MTEIQYVRTQNGTIRKSMADMDFPLCLEEGLELWQWEEMMDPDDGDSDWHGSSPWEAGPRWQDGIVEAYLNDLRTAFPWPTGDASIYQWVKIFSRRNWSPSVTAHRLATRLSMVALRMYDITQVEEWKKVLTKKNHLFIRPLFRNKQCHQILTLIEETLKAIIAGTEEPYRYIGWELPRSGMGI